MTTATPREQMLAGLPTTTQTLDIDAAATSGAAPNAGSGAHRTTRQNERL
jgi:hypothetical protein